MSTTLPPSISHPLVVYLADDGNVWAVNSADGRGYPLTGAGSAGPAGDMNKAVFANGSGASNPNEVDRSMSADSLVGGIPSDPTKVAKAGDTMTGELTIKGDQFDQNITPSPSPALAITSSQNGPVGWAICTYGDGMTTAPLGKSLRLYNGAFIALADATSNVVQHYPTYIRFVPGSGTPTTVANDPTRGDLTITSNQVGNGLQLLCGTNSEQVRLHLSGDGNGDLIVTSLSGPNSGKSVNLTVGKWA
jgi:hypothetical protein